MAASAQTRKKKAALLAIASNTFLVIGKFVVGLITGSTAVVSEAVHSSTDLMASIFAFLSVQVSDTPADDDHPFGHGKIESISSLFEAALIFVAAIYIIRESIMKLMEKNPAVPRVEEAVLIMGISACANFFLSGHLKKVGRETDSQALQADGAHLGTDVFTSVGVLVGLVLTRITGAAWLDPVAALAVALLILHAGYELTHQSLAPLLDARLPDAEEERIRSVLDVDDRVLGYHKLRTRKSGSQRHVDVHVQIDDDSTLVEAHDCTEEIEDQIRLVLPGILINIHIEPYRAELAHQQEVHGLGMEEVNLKRKPP
jgi:cation diffusion facilitator family transporter